MKFLLMLCLLFPLCVLGQPSGSDTVRVADLIREALSNNREMEAAELLRDAAEERVTEAGALDDPELTYMREEMPDFRWSEAQMQKIELMQMFRFPTKLAKQMEVAEIAAEHLHHEHMEIANEILSKVRSMYAELWFAQRAQQVNHENARLLQRFVQIAQTRYSVGAAAQQDVLKAYVERARLDNEQLQLRQQELTAKAMLQSYTNRSSEDTLGTAVLPDEMRSLLPVDSLETLARKFRGMLLHDSLSILEGDARVSLARSEMIPDFKLGVQYVSIPGHNFKGWSVTAGITLPFAPWTLSKASSRIEEAKIMTKSAHAKFAGTRAMVVANVRELSVKAEASKRQLENYLRVIVPQSRQALQASAMAYETGKTDYLMLIDSYRMFAMLSMEQLMLRMQYEQSVAELIRTVGYSGIFEVQSERN